MQCNRADLAGIYICPRVEEKLCLIKNYPITTIIAPMGYGKTTSIRYFLKKYTKKGSTHLIHLYNNNYNDFWEGFKRSFRECQLYDEMSDVSAPEDSFEMALVVERISQYIEQREKVYIFVDDFHYMSDKRALEFLLMLVGRCIDNLCVIISSRNEVIPKYEMVRLGNRYYRIDREDITLTREELTQYVKKLKLPLSSSEIDSLAMVSEGWFSAIYLNFCSYIEKGHLLLSATDIYDMFNEAMISPLNVEERSFLEDVSLADEFSIEEAKILSGNDKAEVLLKALSRNNAFIRKIDEHDTYRFHPMMQECMRRALLRKDEGEVQNLYLSYARLYEGKKNYIKAFYFYKKAERNKEALHALALDRGVLLASCSSSEISDFVKNVKEDTLKQEPVALLVLMRRFFSWKKIPEMLKLSSILEDVIESKVLKEEERLNLSAERELIMSFLAYNDIEKMSEYHQRAGKMMNRLALSISQTGSYTFGSPSVLMMFHRNIGKVAEEVDSMYRCMPYYYALTDGHGMGSEILMDAERAFYQGCFPDSVILLEQSYRKSESKGQDYLILACDFLSLRLHLFGSKNIKKNYIDERRKCIKKHLDSMQLRVFDAILGYYYAILGDKSKIPGLFSKGTLKDVHLLYPARAMFAIVQNQVFLARGEYAKLISFYPEVKKYIDSFSYLLCTQHLYVQMASAYSQMGKEEESAMYLKKALEICENDDLFMVIAENFSYIQKVQYDEKYENTMKKVRDFALILQNNIDKYYLRNRKRVLPDILSETEKSIFYLAVDRKTNREIAEAMCLSEGTIKQYLNQIYAKLHIEGNTRNKREKLLYFMNKEDS